MKNTELDKLHLQFRLGCHKLLIATGRRTGVARACRLSAFCDARAVGDEKYLVFECAQLAPLRAKYAHLFNDVGRQGLYPALFFCAAAPSESVSLCRRLL